MENAEFRQGGLSESVWDCVIFYVLGVLGCFECDFEDGPRVFIV